MPVVQFVLVSAVAIDSGSAPAPGYFRVLWELIIGYIFAAIGLGLPALGLAALGVFDWHGAVDNWPVGGPFVPVGLGAVSADVFCALVVVGVSMVIIAGSMQAAVGLPVSTLVTGAIVILTGVAPFLFLHLLPVTGPASPLLAAYLIRKFAVNRSFTIRLRPARSLLVIAIAVVVVGVAVTTSYGVTHPLWPNTVSVGDERVSFSLRNAGFADVTIIRMSTDARINFGLREQRSVNGLVVPARGSLRVTLLKRGCPYDLRVQYRLRGRTMTAPLRPDTGSQLAC
jgi:hypothetical protein